MQNTPKRILIHCSDVSFTKARDQFKSVNVYHRDERGFPRSSLGFFVGYHRLATGGLLYKCKEDSEEGAHCNQLYTDGVSMNWRSLGICCGFDGDVELMPSPDYELLQKQVWDWQDLYKIADADVVFHRLYATGKTCPGSLLDAQWLKNLLTRPVKPQPDVQPVPQPKPADQCAKQEGIIKAQAEQIGFYQGFVKGLMDLINSFSKKI
jgi:hypothetical protein